MFLVIPLVEFLHVLGVDIDVHHENPATFLCHVSVSSVKHSCHHFASSRWHPVLTPGAQERHETTHPQIPGLLSVIFRLIEAHRNEIRAQPASFVANRSGCSRRGSETRGFASFPAHLCLRRLSLSPRGYHAGCEIHADLPACHPAVGAIASCSAPNGSGCQV